ncbi:unnamed protein product [Auanema sp. JU1783]|nr:unnamed protein product [Auanema sp. JU1783]
MLLPEVKDVDGRLTGFLHIDLLSLMAIGSLALHNMLLIFCFVLIPEISYGQMEGQMGQRIQNGGFQQHVVPQCPREWQWPCRNGECIPSYDICDGIAQCADESDEWNCNQMRMNQMPKWNNYGNVVNRYPSQDTKQEVNKLTQSSVVATTVTTTTTNSSANSYVTLSKKDITVSLLIFMCLAACVFMVIRRRARRRALNRNRRGFVSRDDSDEDDLLIRSMYS